MMNFDGNLFIDIYSTTCRKFLYPEVISNEERISYSYRGRIESVNCTESFFEVFINMFVNQCKKLKLFSFCRGAPCWPQINKSHEPSTHYPYFFLSSNETEWAKEKQAETSWQKIDSSVSCNKISFEKVVKKIFFGSIEGNGEWFYIFLFSFILSL